MAKFPQISLPLNKKEYEHIFQMFSICLPDKNTRDSLQQHLIRKQIFSKVYFKPIHLTSYYMQKFGTKPGMLPVTEFISERILTLPLYPNMTNEEKNYLVDSISEFFDSI